MSFRNATTPSDAVEVTASDTDFVDLVGLYVGGAGDVAVVTSHGTTTTFAGVPAGSIIPLRIVQVKAATTATDIVGFKA